MRQDFEELDYLCERIQRRICREYNRQYLVGLIQDLLLCDNRTYERAIISARQLLHEHGQVLLASFIKLLDDAIWIKNEHHEGTGDDNGNQSDARD